jgi:circadian clock protein KaiC
MLKKIPKTKKIIGPKNLTERVPTGIKGFDDLIEGGFKKDSINLISGGPGGGKTLFAMQFLLTGIEKYNENVLYITFEEKKEKLYSDLLGFGWDVGTYEKNKKFMFLEYTPEQVKKLLVEGGGAIESLVEKYNVKRIVIDSITSFGLLYQDELTKKESALALFELIGKWNCTALLTAQETGDAEEQYISSAVGFETDSIMLLYHTKNKQGRRIRAIEILKMRGTKHAEGAFAFEITKKGIEIKKQRVII